MPGIPRTVGLPLDAAAARTRAEQIRTLADPLRLRVLSAIAAGVPVGEVAGSLGSDQPDVDTALSALAAADLIRVDEQSDAQLTADAWVRFGRLVTPGVAFRSIEDEATRVLEPMPPVAARIAQDLSYRYSSVFSPETVARYVGESYALLADRANISTHLPSLTAKFASDRLSALATAEGLVLRGSPEVLFVCVQNAGRSQIASAVLRHLAGDAVHVRTAGSAPASVVNPAIVEILDEVGIPMAAEFPKPLTDEVVQAADYIITMGCGDACPIYPGRRYMDWELDDPIGLDRDGMRRVRDEIIERVRDLLSEMNPGPTSHGVKRYPTR